MPRSKIVDYLMSASHEDGDHKYRFFAAHGFAAERPDELSEALLRHAMTAVEVTDSRTLYGRKWSCEDACIARMAASQSFKLFGSGKQAIRAFAS